MLDAPSLVSLVRSPTLRCAEAGQRQLSPGTPAKALGTGTPWNTLEDVGMAVNCRALATNSLQQMLIDAILMVSGNP